MREKLKNLVNLIAPNHLMLFSKLISQELEKFPSEPITVLDIGGGAGEYWLKDDNLNKFLRKGQLKVTIIDAQIPNPKDFSELDFKQGFAPKDLSQFSDSRLDMVIASDSLEHLSKEDGYILLYEMERLAKKLASFLPQMDLFISDLKYLTPSMPTFPAGQERHSNVLVGKT